MINGKKGQAIYYIIGIVILLVSFAVILVLYNRFSLGSTTNSEICHNSVLLQSKSAHLAPGGLQCKTDYVCISGGGKCSNMNPTETISVNLDNKEEIVKAIADQMSKCWYTFGEGNLDYEGVSSGGVCGVCAVIGFDTKIQSVYTGTENPANYGGFANYNDCINALGYGSQVCSIMFPNGQGASSTPSDEITYKDLLNYLATQTTTQAGGNETYLYYLYGDYNLSYLLSASPTINQFYNSQIISPSGTYNVVTGENKNIFTILSKGNYLPPILINTTGISQYLGEQCGTFITQS